MANIFDRIFNPNLNEVSLKSLKKVLEHIPVSVVITNPRLPDNPIIFCNYMFEVVTGYSQNEVLGRNCRFLQRDYPQEEVLNKLRKGIQDKVCVNVVIKNYMKDGREFDNELIIVPVFELGELSYFVAIQNDLSRPSYLK